jgi:hypothetical protein
MIDTYFIMIILINKHAKMFTVKVIEEFNNTIDTNRVYDLEELKTIIGDVFKKVKDDEKNAKKNKKLDENGEKKPKRAPTAYNNFTSFKMKEIRSTDPSITAKEAMKKAAAAWKEMSDEEKNEYKKEA